MNQNDFINWLKGFLDAVGNNNLTAEQSEMIRNRLNTVVSAPVISHPEPLPFTPYPNPITNPWITYQYPGTVAPHIGPSSNSILNTPNGAQNTTSNKSSLMTWTADGQRPFQVDDTLNSGFIRNSVNPESSENEWSSGKIFNSDLSKRGIVS